MVVNIILVKAGLSGDNVYAYGEWWSSGSGVSDPLIALNRREYSFCTRKIIKYFTSKSLFNSAHMHLLLKCTQRKTGINLRL